MNIILFLTLILIILIYINYKKYYNNNSVKETLNILKKKKSVSWNDDIIIDIIKSDNICESNIYENYTNDINEFDDNISSKIINYLSDLKNSQDQIKFPEITNTYDNIRIQEFKDNIVDNNIDNMTIGDIYDNLVDDSRIIFGKIEHLQTYNNDENNNFYSIHENPTKLGYTNFATY